MTDASGLRGLVDLWWHSVGDFLALVERVREDQWTQPTDLPGWDVHAVVAHIAHLETMLAGGREQPVDVGQPAHAKGDLGRYLEQGVVARRDRSPDELIIEIVEATSSRHRSLVTSPPTDLGAPVEPAFGGLTWTWDWMLSNRPVDIWMHEQDIRRALDWPGGMESLAADYVTEHLMQGMGRMLAKQAGAPAGTTLLLHVAGSTPLAFGVTDEGRGERLDMLPLHPTVRLVMDRASFVVLAGGRRAPQPGAVLVTGDEDLGRHLLQHFAVTP